MRRKTIERVVAQDLIDTIYRQEGWAPRDRASFNSCAARCNSLYDITADPRRNRYIAVPKDARLQSLAE